MKRALSLLVFLLALAGPAFGGAWSSSCTFSGTVNGVLGTPSQGVLVSTVSNTIGPNPPSGLGSVGDSTTLCYRWTPEVDGAHNAGPFVVAAPTAQIVFDPQLNGTGVATATVIPHLCTSAIYTAASPQNSCTSMGGANGAASLTGLEGPDSTQNATKWIGPGVYYLELSACAAGETCQVMIRGSR